jgi:hypothetical protein
MQQVAQNTAPMAYEQSKSNQLIAMQNDKLAKIYKVVLEDEKRQQERKLRINSKYDLKEKNK